jgi:uncharacterized membrane protein YedE/YeeE
VIAGALVTGLLFALGLGLGGMTQPAKVVGFLDIAGGWDPSLAYVMAGALLVHGSLVGLVLRRKTPVFASRFALPTRTDLDTSLFAGAVVFGVGWGLVGFCPGPAITALGAGMPEAAVFVSAMLLGMALEHLFERGRAGVARGSGADGTVAATGTRWIGRRRTQLREE